MIGSIARKLLKLVALALLAGLLTILFVGWRINSTGAKDSARQTDAIVILGARVEPDGTPGPDLLARTMHGVRLFQRGFAPYLVCTGGFDNDRLSAASVACATAVEQGVPRQSVLLADGSMTTREDAVSAHDLFAARGWQTAILVSHPLHLERARILFESQGIEVFPSPTSTDLGAIPMGTRAWLTARETVGIIWHALETFGVPYEWTGLMSRLVYGVSTSAVGD
ncbi:YdcF family protein [Chloroflexota bacterium]